GPHIRRPLSDKCYEGSSSHFDYDDEENNDGITNDEEGDEGK
ncbi:hypothetical protein Tco_0815470, partial [Tanacetum coccineum]